MIRQPPLPEAPHQGPRVAKNANHLFAPMSIERFGTLRHPRHSQDASIACKTGEASPLVYERVTHFGGIPVKVVGNPFGYFLTLQVSEGADKGRLLTCDLLEDIRSITIRKG